MRAIKRARSGDCEVCATDADEASTKKRLKFLYLVPEFLAQILLGDALLLHVKVEKVWVETWRTRLVIRIVISRQIRMLETLFYRETVAGVKGECLLQEIDRFR